MSNSKSIQDVLYASLATAICLILPLAIGFLGGNQVFKLLNVHLSGFLSGAIPFVVILLLLAIGGWTWGTLMARRFGGDAKATARKAALIYPLVILGTGILLEMVFGALGALMASGSFNLPIHHAFTIVFVISAGLITFLTSRFLLEWLGRKENAGTLLRNTTLAGALGFFIVNMVMLSMGWKVGSLGAELRMTMIKTMLFSNTGAALLGGAVLGRGLGMMKPDGEEAMG